MRANEQLEPPGIKLDKESKGHKKPGSYLALRAAVPAVDYASWQKTSWRYITGMETGRTTGTPTWRYFMVTATTRYTTKGANDNGPCAEEPCEGKLSRTVLNWRRDGRPPRRPIVVPYGTIITWAEFPIDRTILA